ncbi:MAG TPA: sigma-70 family RNA polymerase sigma factor [Brevefilum sp.]|nr:sigma-70 family RNA polymerase sigma factor [Brevefilum sp.]HOR19151.1 sigma-70 family RNA polymerase sigma factor [Brevefilum sp.]HPL69629.1 sigma-70 family RNA polymerase sigma factor [Brevefilum sp.]
MTNQIISDAIDLAALRRKDKDAFTQLVKADSGKIYRLALKMLANEQDAEDVLQETFIKAYKNIETFEGRSKISTWLYRIAVNEALMLIRKRKPAQVDLDAEIITESGEFVPRQIVDWCCLPEEEFVRSETRQVINLGIKSLSDANRAAFLLRDVEGLSTREAAEVLQISESALKVRLMRARLELREFLTEYFSGKMPEVAQ